LYLFIWILLLFLSSIFAWFWQLYVFNSIWEYYLVQSKGILLGHVHYWLVSCPEFIVNYLVVLESHVFFKKVVINFLYSLIYFGEISLVWVVIGDTRGFIHHKMYFSPSFIKILESRLIKTLIKRQILIDLFLFICILEQIVDIQSVWNGIILLLNLILSIKIKINEQLPRLTLFLSEFKYVSTLPLVNDIPLLQNNLCLLLPLF